MPTVSTILVVVAVLSGGTWAAGAARPTLPVEINRLEAVSAWPLMGPLTYDCEPSVGQLPDGAYWAVWQTYHDGREQIVGRVVRDARQDRPVAISAHGIVSHPKVLARDAANADVVWSAFEGGRWRIKARALRAGKWADEQVISGPDEDAIHPTAVKLGDGGIAIAWSGRSEGRFRVCVREWRNGIWSAARPISNQKSDAFRPALAVGADGEVWGAWDAYIDGEYAIRARRVIPDFGPEEPVSLPGVKCLNPTIVNTRFGPCAAWVKVVDVQGGDGVIDQFHTLQMALRRDSGWRVVTDADGKDDAAELHHGFLAKMDPKPVWSTGYLGRRRQPLLFADTDGVWLLWERKADHMANTPNARGELLGRRYDGALQPAVRIHAGLLEYQLVSGARAVDDRLPVIGSDLPRERRRIYQIQSANLRSSERIAVEPWAGWRPQPLPLRARSDERRAVQINGRTYRLYWVDSHVHSNLTADAEGEPDEIIHYARDKAHLDAVVIQENDLLYDVPLTESEYALGAFFARSFSRSRQFLVLPGYEWTQILPVGGGDPAQPQFWTASTRNHRTVVYPLSGGPLLRYTEVGNDINRLYAAVAQHGGVTHAQHQTFELNGHPAEVAVEVAAGWGIYFLNTARIHRALQEGNRIGFVGTSDGHRRTPGLSGGITGVYAEELTDVALLDAYRARRVFATTGTRFAIEAWANDAFMGQETIVARGAPVRLVARVRSPVPVKRLVLISGGAEVRSFAGEGRSDLEVVHETDALPAGRHWFYWRVETAGPNTEYPGNLALAEGNLGWSTPVWVTQQ